MTHQQEVITIYTAFYPAPSHTPAGLGFSLHCAKPSDSLEFRPFNFKVQTHLLVMVSLTESPLCLLLKGLSHILFSGMFISTLGLLIASPTFRQNILSSGLTWGDTLGFGTWRTCHYSSVDAFSTTRWPKCCRLIVIYISVEDFATFLTFTTP